MLAIPAQQLLLIAALAANAVRYGVRPGIVGWPLAAVLLLLLLSALAADRDPHLTVGRMAIAALGLALPWSLPEIGVEPGTRARYALLIALLPCLCVAAGFALQAFSLHAAYTGSDHRILRLHGASNAGWLVCLAFAGFAIALHEARRARQAGFAWLAGINLVIGVLTGGRMGVAAGALFALAYGLLDERVRARLRRARWPLVGLGLAAALLLLGWLVLQSYHEPEDSLDMSGRDTIWAHYLAQFRQSPTFGHGVGGRGARQELFRPAAQRLSAPAGRGRRVRPSALRRGGPALGPPADRPHRPGRARLRTGDPAGARGLRADRQHADHAADPDVFFYLGLMLGEPYGQPPADAAATVSVAPAAAALPNAGPPRSARGPSSGP